MSILLVRIPAPDSEEQVEERNDQNISTSLPVVLGRGSLLKCGEKKVSRRHAYLDWDDDGVLLTSVHQNPTFIVTKKGEKQLTEGSSALLSDGDKFGLLENSFWYKVSLPSLDTQDTEKARDNKVAATTSNTDSSEKRVKGKDKETNAGKSSAKNQNSAKNYPLKEPMKVDKDTVQSDKENVNIIKGKSTEKTETDITKETTVNNDSLESKPQKAVQQQDCTVFSQQEIQSSISPRKRNLPTWLTKTTAKPDGPSTITPDIPALHSHGGARKTGGAATKKKKAEKNLDRLHISDVSEDKNNLKPSPTKKDRQGKQDDKKDNKQTSDSPPSTPKRKAPTPSPKKATKNQPSTPKRKAPTPSPKKATKNQGKKKTTSPLKQGTKKQHVMSDDSNSEEDIEDNDDGVVDQVTRKVKSPEKKKQKPAAQHPMSDEEDENTSVSKGKSPAKGKKRNVPASRPAMSESEDSDGSTPASSPAKGGTTTPAPSPTKNTPRQSCQYGAKCYRKNPQHRKSFAHPGDLDFREPGSDNEDSEEDDRPECEHGVDCYRRNKEHRRQFKHTRFPQPKRRAKRKAQQQKQKDGSDSEDDYDYDDPFLNDDSTDDYAPTDDSSDSNFEPSQDADEEEETSRMLSEGKKFVKQRR